MKKLTLRVSQVFIFFLLAFDFQPIGASQVIGIQEEEEKPKIIKLKKNSAIEAILENYQQGLFVSCLEIIRIPFEDLKEFNDSMTSSDKRFDAWVELILRRNPDEYFFSLLAQAKLQGKVEGATSSARFNLGWMHMLGLGGLIKNDQKAVKWFTRAAYQGNAKAQNNLGEMYRQGRGGLSQNDQEAIKWFTLATNQGDAEAQTHLGWMHLQGLGGLIKNNQEAIRLFVLAANQGYGAAQYDLGWMYKQGRGGLNQNDQEAAKWWSLAENQ